MDTKKDAAKLILDGKEVDLTVITDNMGGKSIDITATLLQLQKAA